MKTFFNTICAAVFTVALFTGNLFAGHCGVSSCYNVRSNYVAPVVQHQNYNQNYNFAYPVVAVPIVAVPVQKAEVKVQVPVVQPPVVTTMPAMANYSNPVVGFQLYALQNYNNYGVGQYSFSVPYSNIQFNQNYHSHRVQPQADGPRGGGFRNVQLIRRGGRTLKITRNRFGRVIRVQEVQSFQSNRTVVRIERRNGRLFRVTRNQFGRVIHVQRLQSFNRGFNTGNQVFFIQDTPRFNLRLPFFNLSIR